MISNIFYSIDFYITSLYIHKTIYIVTEICAQKPNEYYKAGGSPCQTCCTNPEAPCRINTFAAVNACYCVEGTARLQNGECVSIDSRKCRNERIPNSGCNW